MGAGAEILTSRWFSSLAIMRLGDTQFAELLGREMVKEGDAELLSAIGLGSLGFELTEVLLLKEVFALDELGFDIVAESLLVEAPREGRDGSFSFFGGRLRGSVRFLGPEELS